MTSETKVDSNSIATRIRRNRERLPSCLLIENVSAIMSARHFRTETFPIKASDDTVTTTNKEANS